MLLSNPVARGVSPVAQVWTWAAPAQVEDPCQPEPREEAERGVGAPAERPSRGGVQGAPANQ